MNRSRCGIFMLMDLLAHAAYGATVCSRAGVAGGKKGPGCRWFADKTVWWAALFGVLPDALSMGVPFLLYWHGDMQGHFFQDMDSETLIHYRYAHSLIVAFLISGIFWWIGKPLFIASLAWPLHIIMDAFTHGASKFHTTLFYPLSEWSLQGISWWQHPEIGVTYWAALPVIWLGLWAMHRSS